MSVENANALRIFIGGLAVGLVMGAGAVLLATRPLAVTAPAAVRSSQLSAADRLRFQDLLAAGKAYLRMENYEAAAAIYERVLTEFDCANVEAQKGMRALAPERLESALASCQESHRS